MQTSPPSNEFVINLAEKIISCLLGLFFLLIGWAWKAIHSDLKATRDYVKAEADRTVDAVNKSLAKNRAYHYNTMTTVFRVLQKLHPEPNKATVISEAMLEFMQEKSEDRSNGKSKAAGTW